MAKELPYFRFTAFEWLNDDISLESYEVKGLFSDVCAYYWMQDCDVTLDKLKKRFSNATILLEQLLKSDIIKHENKHDKIKIDFLLTQYDLLSEKRKLRQSAGSKGGNAKAMLKQKGSYKDKDNNKDKIEIDTRKLKFADTLKPFVQKYGKEMIRAFYDYWTEPNKSNSKFKQELQKTWSLERRLDTWNNNESSFKPKKQLTYNHDTNGLLQ
jgi:hypothetical protein